jgi:magnesium-transporting ATPase (P-type)
LEIIILGDNILTAVSVAKECGIVLPSKTVVDVTADESQGCSPKIYYTASGITSPMVYIKLMFELLILSYIIYICTEGYIHVRKLSF